MGQLLMLKQRQCGENKWKITISNVKYDKGNIAKWQVKYKLVEDGHWNTTEDYDFFVYKSGTYIIKLVNNDVESEIKQIKLVVEEEHYISKTEPYVGYYADIEGDGIVDGIIYADLAIGEKGMWNNREWNNYEYNPETKGLKEYYVNHIGYKGIFGTKDVLSPKGSGKERFYVMSLDDINSGTKYSWYNAACEGNGKLDNIVDSLTNNFGKGKINTLDVMAKWVKEEWGKQNSEDFWGTIKLQVEKGWFVPSKSEWAAFGNLTSKLGITTANYANYNIKDSYWSSSQAGTDRAFVANFNEGSMIVDGIVCAAGPGVRLSIVF